MTHDSSVEASLGLGGNIGDVAASFVHALQRLGAAQGVTLRRVSSVYVTPPWGKLDQPAFLNMAALIETTLSARALLAVCLNVEQALGRRRLERWGPRTLDIDILTYGDTAIAEPDLETPHPRIAERAFVLAPLVEIAPHLRIGGREVSHLLAQVDATGINLDREATAKLRAALKLADRAT